VTNYYGLYIANPTINATGNTATRWAIYSLDTSASYIRGSLLVGTTTNANYKVDINGTLRSSDSAYFATSSGNVTIGNLAGTGTRLVTADANGVLGVSGLASGIVTGSGTTNYVPKWTSSSGLGNSQIFDNGTNVGIGTTSPVNYAGGYTTVAINNATTGGVLDFYSNNVQIGQLYNNANDFNIGTIGSRPLLFFTNGTEKARIFANGRIGVNTTTDAGYQLDVNGSIRAIGLIRSQATVGNTNGYFQLEHPGSQTWKLGVFTDNTSTFSIGNDNGGVFASRYLNITNVGDIGIATTSPSYKLDINGTLRSVNGANFATTSGNVGIGTATAVGKLTINSALGDHIRLQRSGQTDRAIVITSSDQLVFGTWASPT
ncbi:MAG: hypothetical protein ACK5XN_24785, partial [Bacteroidota bacterium]